MRLVAMMLVMLGLALSACGRKGDLQPPPGPNAPEKPVKTRGLF